MPPAVEEKQSEDAAVSEVFLAEDIAPTRRLSPKKIIIKLLYNPLTGLAIGLHLLLLIVPFDPSVKTAEVVEAPEEDVNESIPVDILNLAEIASPTPPPEKPPVPAAPAPAAPAPVPAPVAPAPVPADPVPAEPVVADSVPADPEQPAPDPPTQDPSGEEPQPSAYDPTETQNAFVGNIASLGISTFQGNVQFPPENFFAKGNATSFLDFSDPRNPAPLANSRSAVWMDEQLSDVITTLNTAYGDAVVLTPVEDYAGELMYELTDATGNSFMHVSLVEFRSGSTLLVMWPNHPNAGSA